MSTRHIAIIRISSRKLYEAWCPECHRSLGKGTYNECREMVGDHA